MLLEIRCDSRHLTRAANLETQAFTCLNVRGQIHLLTQVLLWYFRWKKDDLKTWMKFHDTDARPSQVLLEIDKNSLCINQMLTLSYCTVRRGDSKDVHTRRPLRAPVIHHAPPQRLWNLEAFGKWFSYNFQSMLFCFVLSSFPAPIEKTLLFHENIEKMEPKISFNVADFLSQWHKLTNNFDVA